MVARCSTRSALWTASSAALPCGLELVTAAPAAVSASSTTVARSGTSVPVSQTPSQTSPPGSWRRQSGFQTTGTPASPGFVMLAISSLGNDCRVARAVDLGISIGILPNGQTTSIVDVPGVGVGHATVWRDEPPPPQGRGVARTGVTVIDLGGNIFRSPVPAGGAVLNGAGECTGFLAAAEWGLVETPIFLTSTMQLGRVYDAACELLMEEDPAIGDEVIIPVVAECDDSFLSESRRMQVNKNDVRAALEAARANAGGPAPEEGAVGSGTGMSCLGFKGGIGSASRRTPSGHHVGALLMSNFSSQERLTIDGVPVGRLLPPDAEAAVRPPAGSCIAIVVTDAPIDSAGC